jgi:N-acyl-D-aspartate/D-glutamate deacylase
VPGTFAPDEEYFAVADAMADAGGGMFQAVLDFDTKFAHEIELLRAMAARTGNVLFSAGVGNNDGDAAGFWGATLGDIRANAGGITALSMTRPSGSLMGLHQVPPVAGSTWRSVMTLPTLEARLEALADAGTRRDLVEEGKARGTWYDARHIYPLGSGPVPDYHVEDDDSVAVLAERAGMHPVEWIIERLLESDGREMFNVWFFNRNRAAYPELLNLDEFCPGLGDAGAHAGQICDADAPTHYLAYWCRERRICDLPSAIRNLTSKPAAVLGLRDRGTLTVGSYADLNVFDPEHLQVGYPEYVHDFPNGKGRLRVGATGYAATFVNGELVTEQGRTTGRRPGRVLRDFVRSR